MRLCPCHSKQIEQSFLFVHYVDLIRDIRDPEKDNTLEELDVVYESGVHVEPWGEDKFHISIEFTPTVPHCSLATLIGEALVILGLRNNRSDS